ncbi:2',3'-cyclic-nucleotide 3'-phosphodiesterase isoform X2 [Mustelus asterias]
MRSAVRRLIRNLVTMGQKTSKSKSNHDYNHFPFFSDGDTIQTVKEAHTFFILRGLPGSVKSTFGPKLLATYPSSIACTMETAPVAEQDESDGDWFAQVDEKIQQGMKDVKNVILVDDNHRSAQRLDYLAGLAKDNDYIVVIVTSVTKWEKPADSLERIIPYYFGWFLVRKSAQEMRKNAKDFLKLLTCNKEFLEEFKPNVEWHSEEEFNLQEYFQKRPSMLHCTTKFCNFGEAPGCESYARSKVVEQNYAKTFTLKVTALFVTPRTVGARVVLDKIQDLLWPREEASEGGGDSAEAKLPFGSRSHISLACAPGIKAVQTGLDLLEILKLEEEGKKPEQQMETEEGLLSCYGLGRWIVKLPKPVEVKTLFSGFYQRKKLTTDSEDN